MERKGLKMSGISGLHEAATRQNPLTVGLSDGVREKYSHLLDLIEYRLGGPDGPRVWFFHWQRELLEAGELRAGYEEEVMNHVALACVLGRNCVYGKGLASLAEDEQWFSVVWLFYEARKKLRRDYLGSRHLWSTKDLGTTSCGRGVAGRGYVVPTVTNDREFKELLARGRLAAAGLPGTRPSAVAPYAFDELAKDQSKKDLDEQTMQRIALGSLIGSPLLYGGDGPQLPVSRDEIQRALDHPFKLRIWSWFVEHHDVHEYPGTRLWDLFGSSVFKDLAKEQENPVTHEPWPGGRLDPKECRRAFVSLIACSYHYLAWWYQAFCNELRKELGEQLGSLSDVENCLFGRIHMPNKFQGNLPAALLAERLWVLRPVLRELWLLKADQSGRPVAKRIPTLLLLYTQILASRRQADRVRKQNKTDRTQRRHEGDKDHRTSPTVAGEKHIRRDVQEAPARSSTELVRKERAHAFIAQHEPTPGPCPKGGQHSWEFDELIGPGVACPGALVYVCGRCGKKEKKPVNKAKLDEFFQLDPGNGI